MVIINIRGVLVDILLEIVPDIYGPYVITDRKGGKKLMFQYQNAIYGTLEESLLYFKNFRKSLRDESYEFNPYDPCVANKITKVIQMAVCFHFKLSYKIPKVVVETIT